MWNCTWWVHRGAAAELPFSRIEINHPAAEDSTPSTEALGATWATAPVLARVALTGAIGMRSGGRTQSALATRGVERHTAPAGLRVEPSRDAIVAQAIDQPFGEREVHPADELAMVLD